MILMSVCAMFLFLRIISLRIQIPNYYFAYHHGVFSVNMSEKCFYIPQKELTSKDDKCSDDKKKRNDMKSSGLFLGIINSIFSD